MDAEPKASASSQRGLGAGTVSNVALPLPKDFMEEEKILQSRRSQQPHANTAFPNDLAGEQMASKNDILGEIFADQQA